MDVENVGQAMNVQHCMPFFVQSYCTLKPVIPLCRLPRDGSATTHSIGFGMA